MPSLSRRSSCCQGCCRVAHSRRVGSLMTHFAWPSLLPRSSLKAYSAVIPLPRLLPGSSVRASLRVASIVGKKLTPSVPARTRRSSCCQHCCQEGPFRACRLAYDSLRMAIAVAEKLSKGASSRSAVILLPTLLPRSSVRACPLAHDSLRMAIAVGKKLIPSVPARTRRSSRCQRCCQEVQSERAGSLMTHFAWPQLLPISSFQACPLALGGHLAAAVFAAKPSLSVPARL